MFNLQLHADDQATPVLVELLDKLKNPTEFQEFLVLYLSDGTRRSGAALLGLEPCGVWISGALPWAGSLTGVRP